MTTLLLVEDEALIALAETKGLRKLGYEVIHAFSGEEALSVVESRKGDLDLILMDIDLGAGMDGTEAAKAVLRDHDLPIIFLSSHMEAALVEKTEEITNYGYVVKSSALVVIDASIKMALKLNKATRATKEKDLHLQQKQEQLNFAIESSQAGVWEWEIGTSRMEISERWAAMLGYRKEELEPQGLAAFEGLLHPDDRAKSEAITRAYLAGTIRKHELKERLRHKDGHWVWILDCGMASAWNEAGRPTRLSGMHFDISQQLAAEEALKFQSLLLDKCPDAVFVLDSEGTITYVNEIALGHSRHSREELLGMWAGDLDIIDGKDKTKDRIARVLEEGSSSYTLKRRTTEGSISHVEVRARAIEFGGVPYVVAAVRDVSERVNTAKNLQNERWRMKSILESTKIGTWEWHYQEHRTTTSPTWAMILGYSPEEVSTLDDEGWKRLTHPDDWVKASEMMARYVESYSPETSSYYEGELRMRHKNGSWVWLLERGRIMSLSEDGQPLVIFGTNMDIGERKQKEEELAETRNRYLELLTSIGEGFCFVDSDKVIRMANPAAHRILRLAEGSLVGRSLYGFLDPEGLAIDREQTALRAKGLGTDFLSPVICADGSRRYLQVSANPMNSLQGGGGTTTVFRDVTDELEAREALTDLVQAKETLMKELEHRVKNSLTIVSSLLSVAMGELEDDKARVILEETEARIRSMSAIYERLYLTDSVESLDFGDYLRGLAKGIYDAFSETSHRIGLVYEVESVGMDTKRAIPLGLVINELITNCFKYAFPGNREGTITLGLSATADTISLVVADDGVGLPRADILEKSPTMGMTLIRLLSAQIGGTLALDLGTGTRVSLSLARNP